MDFEIEYKLELFREEQPILFDENGERYTATPIGKETAEMMLQLINEMEKALAKMPDASKNTLPIQNVSQQRELFYNFITWYNAKPFVKKPKDGLITTTIIEEYLKL